MKKSTLVMLIAGGAALAALPSSTNAPKGIRNNNPLNIEARESWVGQVGDDGRFVVFETVLHGFRAAGRIMKTKAGRGVRTIESIISEWAPPVNDAGELENHTQNYINFVSDETGIAKDSVLSADEYPKVLAAMVIMENGQNPYDQETIAKGFEWGFYG
ncbi:virion protein [Pseudoalteromonas sp. K222D]|uniref:virion protein n=1 Tax=Pseudoalteromonas sp. K222D TaxID=2820756 RepID=UPI001AD74049|nr:virion protein [Pseudoalteromonas sp. K222D]MBO7927997.1 virion protein [Pseudoalteromonas sp. K222D]